MNERSEITQRPTDEHTPGPWVSFYKHKYKEWHVGVPVSSGSMKIALFPDGCPTDHPGPDSRLIAAAPELLALVKQSIDDCFDCADDSGATGKDADGNPCPACKEQRELVARIEGAS